MVHRKQQLKFERNLHIRFRDNCDNYRWTMDKFRFHELCWHSQAELINPNFMWCNDFLNFFGLLLRICWTKCAIVAAQQEYQHQHNMDSSQVSDFIYHTRIMLLDSVFIMKNCHSTHCWDAWVFISKLQ